MKCKLVVLLTVVQGLAFSADYESAGPVEKAVNKALESLDGAGVCDYLSATMVRGKALLEGYVTEPSLRIEAGKAASRVSGVVEVVNRIRVLPSGSDAKRLCREEYNALMAEDRLRQYLEGPHPRIHIVAHDGVMELFGSVNTDSENTLANVYALDGPDSGPLINHIRVLHPMARE
jgi:osmotically-inducible protein OsmY